MELPADGRGHALVKFNYIGVLHYAGACAECHPFAESYPWDQRTVEGTLPCKGCIFFRMLAAG
jgi:hypothetical protein